MVNTHEIRSSMLDLYKRDLVDGMYYESEYAGEYLQPGATPAHEAAKLDVTIDDAWEAVKWWCSFDKKSAGLATAALRSEREELLFPRDQPETSRDRQRNNKHEKFRPSIPFLAPPKIGRNEPCPCGSGKNTRNAAAGESVAFG